jgi:hypothetical protein
VLRLRAPSWLPRCVFEIIAAVHSLDAPPDRCQWDGGDCCTAASDYTMCTDCLCLDPNAVPTSGKVRWVWK